MKIFNQEPETWQELQKFVEQMFDECGFQTEISKVIELVRGTKEIDVYTQDPSSEYKTLILVECKYWNKPVKQEIIHSFRTVIQDSGANVGYIVSKSGFQPGCYKAIEKTNIQLVSLSQLEEIYHLKWRKEMVKKYTPYTKPLHPYWDYTGRAPFDGQPIDYQTQLLIRFAYAPICDLGLRDYFENGCVIYPFSIPVIDDTLTKIGSLEIRNDRDYFTFCEEHKDEVLRRYKILYREIYKEMLS